MSVVSDTPPVPHVPVPPGGKESRVLTWLMESDRPTRTTLHTHSELSGKHRSHRPSSATSPNASRLLLFLNFIIIILIIINVYFTDIEKRIVIRDLPRWNEVVYRVA